jgi:hypothetical protein
MPIRDVKDVDEDSIVQHRVVAIDDLFRMEKKWGPIDVGKVWPWDIGNLLTRNWICLG